MRIRPSKQEEDSELDEEERFFRNIAESARTNFETTAQESTTARESPRNNNDNINNSDHRRASAVSTFYHSQRASSRSARAEVQPAKRSRLSHGSYIDSKPPATSMTGPNRKGGNVSRREVDDEKLFSLATSWEENEPAPLRNHNHFKNHHRNTPLSETTKKPRGKNAARLKNYDDPMEESKDEIDFRSTLKKLGYEVVEQEGDGNCLFRAIALQVYGDSGMHMELREKVMIYMQQNEGHFGEFVIDEVFDDYVERKRRFGVHGNNPEIQAASELFNRPIEVFAPQSGAKPLNIFHKEYSTKDAPIRLSYHNNNHYNAVIDPLNPTAGVGLGLPGLRPGLADKQQVAAATTESDVQSDLDHALEVSHKEHKKQEDYLLQKALKESSGVVVESESDDNGLALSDVEATNFELEQKALQSSLEAFRHDEEQKPKAASKDGNVGSATSGASVPSPEVGLREYPPVVEELVMNGFELDKVLKAYDFIGPSFDQILAFLMANSS